MFCIYEVLEKPRERENSQQVPVIEHQHILKIYQSYLINKTFFVVDFQQLCCNISHYSDMKGSLG